MTIDMANSVLLSQCGNDLKIFCYFCVVNLKHIQTKGYLCCGQETDKGNKLTKNDKLCQLISWDWDWDQLGFFLQKLLEIQSNDRLTIFDWFGYKMMHLKTVNGKS